MCVCMYVCVYTKVVVNSSREYISLRPNDNEYIENNKATNYNTLNDVVSAHQTQYICLL